MLSLRQVVFVLAQTLARLHVLDVISAGSIVYRRLTDITKGNIVVGIHTPEKTSLGMLNTESHILYV